MYIVNSFCYISNLADKSKQPSNNSSSQFIPALISTHGTCSTMLQNSQLTVPVLLHTEKVSLITASAHHQSPGTARLR